MNGLVGLISLFGSVFLPILGFIWYFPAKTWSNTEVASAAALAIIVLLYMLDCLLNNQPNPIFTLATGAISGLVVFESTKYYSPKPKSMPSQATNDNFLN
ncbi:MAG: hypothetical protein AAFR63_03360 [Cyanobacteria bacterium J06631_6]